MCDKITCEVDDMVDRSYKVLIVEDDPIYAEPLQTCLNKAEDFTVIGVTDSAEKAYKLVKSGLPDAMIVDLQLEEGDGLDLLTRIRDPKENLPVQPYILVVTTFNSDSTMLKLSGGLADFVYKKRMTGYKPEVVLNHLRIMSDQFYCNRKPEVQSIDSSLEKEALIRARVDRELDNYYINEGSDAKKYLTEIICEAILIPKYEKLEIGKLYAKVGKMFSKTSHNIDVAISRLLNAAFLKTAQDDLERLYTPYVDIGRGAPKNKEFINFTANKIKKENLF